MPAYRITALSPAVRDMGRPAPYLTEHAAWTPLQRRAAVFGSLAGAVFTAAQVWRANPKAVVYVETARHRPVVSFGPTVPDRPGRPFVVAYTA